MRRWPRWWPGPGVLQGWALWATGMGGGGALLQDGHGDDPAPGKMPQCSEFIHNQVRCQGPKIICQLNFFFLLQARISIFLRGVPSHLSSPVCAPHPWCVTGRLQGNLDGFWQDGRAQGSTGVAEGGCETAWPPLSFLPLF